MFMKNNLTRSNLQFAFDEFVTFCGAEKAAATLKEATGVTDIASVPDAKIVNAMAALVGGLTAQGARMNARSLPGTRRLRTIHSRLDELAASMFGPKGSHERAG